LKNRAVFLDKEGMLAEDAPCDADLARIELAPGAGEALRRLAARGYRLIVVSNRPGPCSEPAQRRREAHIQSLLEPSGAFIDAFYYCPHSPAAPTETPPCDCRKTHDGLIRRAAVDWAVDLAGSWLVGNLLADIRPGRAERGALLVVNGTETEAHAAPNRLPHWYARTFAQAARAVLAADARLHPA
jgi:histidinol-phosphate phosphatase family protein